MKSLVEIADNVRKGEWKATDMVRDAYAKIDERNPALNAFVMTERDRAYAAAEEVDAKVARGEDPGPLAGVPFGVKDLEDTVGYRTTQGCLFMMDTPAKTADSPHVERLKAAGAIVVGKTATAEFGMDSAVFTKAWGVTRNPWNPEMTPGGSSGGSSSAVAAGMVPFATSTDGGGSIRQPAAYTNLIGLKPSHGRIAKRDGFANWSVHGTVTRSVAEHARYLDVAAGPDDRDRQSLPQNPYKYEDIIETLDVAGMRAVFTPDCGYAVVEPEVVDLARKAATRLITAAKLTELDEKFHHTNILRDWGALNLGTLEADFTRDGILPDGFDKLAETTQFYINRVRSRRDEIDFKKSWAQVTKLNYEVADFFKTHDLLLSPATGCKPYKADSIPLQVIDGRDASETGVEPFGMLANACWNPSISIPAGLTSDGLPVGLQITARRHRDDILLRLARIYEEAFPWTYPWD
ncbi:MAG TPA: amidase [Rhizomicrobium sp.]|jgi:aspartyl-tRNA(Asn)/glutamyl-tRNA(Gln) amidotransferase subunit A|nr:amidase [Rhizomicrobium sp.]